jgi:hypothetical protein
MFNDAGKSLDGLQRGAEQRVYAMLGAVCSFHFRPHDPHEPFGPMARFSHRRTAVPEDFRGDPVEVLASNITRIDNPAVRARVADMVWLLERKRVDAGWHAVDGYAETIRSVQDGHRTFHPDGDGVHDFEVADRLRRGIQIARVLGWEKDKSVALRSLVGSLRGDAAARKYAGSFRRLATLDLDYKISAATGIADEAERLAGASHDAHVKHDLLHIAARACRLDKNQSAAERLLLQAAECLVLISQSGAGSGMLEAHWLERAISEMQNVPGTRDRRRRLKHRLVDAQSRIIDEMSHFSHSQDISVEVAAAQQAVAGKPLVTALREFSRLSRAPTPRELEDGARKLMAETPLASMVAATQYDVQGKPVHRDKGLESGDDDAVVQRQIALMERIRRSAVAQARIEPARLKIAEEHYVGVDVIGILCSQSPFVPQDRRAIFASGLVAFLNGDMITALHTLVPQLENSLRHVLRLHGHDVTRLTEDMNQENLSLSALLEKLRHPLIAIFGDGMVADIDSVFDYRGGPNLRNRVAHGLVGQWEPHSDDAIYACWLIFQLCCIPLFARWGELMRLCDFAEGAGVLEAKT